MHNISYHLAEVACSKTRNSRTRKQWNTECRNTKSEMVKPRTLNLEHQKRNSKTGSSTSGMVNLEHQIRKTDLSSPIIGWNKKIRNSKTRNTESGRVMDMEMDMDMDIRIWKWIWIWISGYGNDKKI